MIPIKEVRRAFRNKVYYSSHAVGRMVGRQITPEDVRKLLHNPMCWAEYQEHPGTLRIDGYIEGKGYCGFVVAVEQDNATGESVAVVITVMDDVRIEKRIRIAKERRGL